MAFVPERIVVLSAISSHSNRQAMPWQPERVMSDAKSLWEQRYSYSCHVSQLVSLLSARSSHSNKLFMRAEVLIIMTARAYPGFFTRAYHST